MVVTRRSKQHCQECNADDDSMMVECSKCFSWLHYSCANVDNSIENQPDVPLYCRNCAKAFKHSTTAGHDEVNEVPDLPSNGPINDNLGATKCSRTASQKSMPSMALRQRQILELEILEERRKLRQERCLQADLEDQKAREKRRIFQEEEDLQAKYEIMTGSVKDSPPSMYPESVVSRGNRVSQWIMAQSISREHVNKQKLELCDEINPDTGDAAVINDKHEGSSQCSEFQTNNYNEFDTNYRLGDLQLVEGVTKTPWFAENKARDYFSSVNIQRLELDCKEKFQHTKAQLSMRQALAKFDSLPTFSGEAHEWPPFISQYVRTTRQCGYTDDDNLIRLQRCLKGRALSAVGGQLAYAETVPHVMNTLNTLFGRPEILLASMMQKVKSGPLLNPERLDTIIQFSLSVQHLCATIKAAELAAHLNNPMLLSELVNKLPICYQVEWARCKAKRDVPNLSDFNEWLRDLADSLSTLVPPPTPTKPKPEERSPRRLELRREYIHATDFKTKSETTEITSETKGEQIRCVVCDASEHKFVTECEQFKSLGVQQRWEALRKERLCKKCLRRHNPIYCKSYRECGVNGCKFKHHYLLHDQPTHHAGESQPRVDTEMTHVVSVHQPQSTKLLFRVVPVVLYGTSSSVRTYAFLDEGSSITLMEKQLADQLRLKGGSVEKLCLTWTSGVTREEPDSQKVSVAISGDYKDARRYTMHNVRTVKSLNLPMQSVAIEQMKGEYAHLKDLPIFHYENAVPRILIGVQHANLGASIRTMEGDWGDPVATLTRLGWTLHGSASKMQTAVNDTSSGLYHHFHMICNSDRNSGDDNDLHCQIRDFFSTENFGVKKPETLLESEDNTRARRLLNQMTRKTGDRYTTGLLWRYDNIRLPDSLNMAKGRLLCLEKKMERNPELKVNLIQQIKEYVNKGYARQLTMTEVSRQNPKKWYLPIFTVTNPNKPEKTRLVWDAAATVQGVSLNSMLLPGPDFLTSLFEVLLRFREQPFAIAGDIKEMYHQVKINEDDQDAQRFLWRDGDSHKEPAVYVMRVMTFGASCSPCAAQYVKNTNAQLFKEEHPRAVEAIITNHYVDDWLDSFSSINEAIEVAKSVVKIHAFAGFEIRNFVSNSKQILAGLGEANGGKLKHVSFNNNTEGAKLLGMWWSVSTDTFFYEVNYNRLNMEILDGTRKPTKREVLRTLMMIFDPLGLIAFFLVYIKMLLQDIWKSAIDWDDSITPRQYVNWMKWVRVLPMLKDIRIPRCYVLDEYQSVQLHIFVDASENAFAALAYFRFEGNSGIRTALINAKTKVAPLQPVSIPRLELQAAVLGARLADTICKSHKIILKSKTFWSDSQDVLSWLRSQHRKYRQFVALRIGEILETTNVKDWRWVPTKQNVADEGTRWKETPQISSSDRWFVGPEFLSKSESEWPTNKIGVIKSDEEVVYQMSHVLDETSRITPDVVKFSKWRRLVRAQAWALRFFRIAKGTHSKFEKGELTVIEITEAKNELFRMVQAEAFADEICRIKGSPGGFVDKGSWLHKLSPFFDDASVLRMRGRTTVAADISYEAKNPIFLPKDHPITNLIIMYYHEKYHHHNRETTVNEIRQKYIIPQLRAKIKRVCSNCQFCKNNRTVPNPPEMADHPKARLAAFTRPFSYVGIDYFGPMEVTVGRRSEKRWGVLFTCLTVRAIHIEIAHSLSKSSCMMAIRNFILQRGTPVEIRTDNGTNFRGVHNELQEQLRNIQPDDYKREFQNINWKFNPPSAPHMGGCWERLVRSVKKCLMLSMPSRKPDDETLRNFLKEAEHTINSRPLTYIPTDPENEEALTPNHFLLGSTSGVKPTGEYGDDVLVLRRNWEISQRLADHFWRRWIAEYMPELRRRTKWFEKVEPIKVGDLVIIMDTNKRNSWKRGGVLETVADRKNGQTRQVIVRTSDGVFRRPATKVALLDVSKPTLE